MFCGKCGVKNADDAAFCSACGAKLNGAQPVSDSAAVAVDQSDKNRKVGIIAVAVIAVLVIALAIGLFGGRSYKATVDKFIDAQFEGDLEAIFELVPDELIDYVMEEEGYDRDEFDEFLEEGQEELQEQLDVIKAFFGDDWEVSYEILEAEDVTGDDLKDLKEDYEDIDLKIKAAKTVEIELTFKAGEIETSESLEISLIKVGRSWYLDMESMGSIF